MILIVINMTMLMTKLTVMSRTTLEKAVRKPILILPARSTHHQTLQHCHHHPQYLQQHHDFDCNKKNDNNYYLDENDNNHNNQCEPVIPRKMMDRMKMKMITRIIIIANNYDKTILMIMKMWYFWQGRWWAGGWQWAQDGSERAESSVARRPLPGVEPGFVFLLAPGSRTGRLRLCSAFTSNSQWQDEVRSWSGSWMKVVCWWCWKKKGIDPASFKHCFKNGHKQDGILWVCPTVDALKIPPLDSFIQAGM